MGNSGDLELAIIGDSNADRVVGVEKAHLRAQQDAQQCVTVITMEIGAEHT